MRALIEVTSVAIQTPGGRPLFDALTLRLSREHVAVIGRNGVGKSTLLSVLAGTTEVAQGRVKTASKPHLVPQVLPSSPTDQNRETRSRMGSHGERRRRALATAQRSEAEILLLDEPSEDLDEAAVSWLRAWLPTWPGCLVVATHDRRLLADFRHFFIVSESGCRYFSGTLDELDAELEREHQDSQQRYVKNLHRLSAREEQSAHVARRKARKKRYGRCKELDRATPRILLNKKRNDAQVSHGRIAKVREERLEALRQWSKSTRRALDVRLPLELQIPTLPIASTELLVLRGVSSSTEAGPLFGPVDLCMGRRRLAVVGPNGAGKTTLIDIMLGRRPPTTGVVTRELGRIGAIAQGASDWMLDDSLLLHLTLQRSIGDVEELAQVLLAHKFPLALAERPMRTLSPGERTRAALIGLFGRTPAPELLILDEPTYSLDLVGQRALVHALRAWPGGLVVASHDRTFLAEIGVDDTLELGP